MQFSNNRRILYVGQAVKHMSKSGYDVINLRNIRLLKSIYKDNAYVYEINSTSSSIFTRFINICNLLIGNDRGIKNSDYINILKIIRDNKINDVFLSSSLYGKLASRIKIETPDVRIISFFHNIETHYNSEELKLLKGINKLKKIIMSKIHDFNELCTVRKSDLLVTLNNRDALMLYKIYNRKSDMTLPTSFDDLYNVSKAKKYVPFLNGRINLLFVGVSFFANIHGVMWFIENVLCNIPNAHLTIAGRGMDKVFANSSQVTVYGYVEDLSDLYYSCDIVVLPIFYGAGMKTKTAEALMYGCPVVGTDEAFEGYDFDITNVGAIANSANEMITSIKNLTTERDKLVEYRNGSRKIFNALYNSNIMVEKLSKMLLE